MFKKLNNLRKIAREYHDVPIIDPQKQHIGIILTMVGFLIYALYTVLFQIEKYRENEPTSISTTFTEFTILNLFMFLFFLPFCLQKGKNYFKCKQPKLIFWRASFSIFCLLTYSLARFWSTNNIDNTILYSADALWVIAIMRFFGFKYHWVIFLGIFIGVWGILYTFSIDILSLHNLKGSSSGLLSGVFLAIVIVLTKYMIKKDPPLRICLYHSLIGTTIFGFSTIFLGFIKGWSIPNIDTIIAMLIIGLLFSLALFCFIEAYYYTEPYIIAAISFFLPVFTNGINWMINRENISLNIIISSLAIILGGLIVIFSPHKTE